MPHPDKDKSKRKVQRLVDVEVTHVSLVDRPANRTPFKAIKRDEAPLKGENSMNITLKNLFGARPAAVASVMADTQDKAVAVAKMLMQDGDAKVSEADGIFTVRKADTKPAAGERVVYVGKGLAYSIADPEERLLTKALALYDGESMDFGETVQKEGFVPGLYTATEALHTTIRNIAMDEGTMSPDDFEAKVSKALDAFGGYVTGLIKALPVNAFKFEKAVLSAVSPNELQTIRPEGDGFNAAVYDAIFGESEVTEEPAEPEAAAEADAATPEGDEAKADADAAPEATAEADAAPAEEDEAGAPADAAPANLEELPKTPAAEGGPTQEQVLAEALASLTKNIGDQIAAAVKPMADRMDAHDAAIQKMSKAVGGAVVSTPEADDDNVVRLNKSDSAPSYGAGGPPLLDTAYRTSKQG